MDKKQADMKSCLQPATKVIVSCRDTNGKNNALAVAYCCNCSFNPPMVMVGIVPTRYSYNLIKQSECFVVNLVRSDFKDVFEYLGNHSGRDEDKFQKTNLRTGEAKLINAPILLDCPVNIECKVVDSILTGSHEMFVGKIEYVHADSQLLDDKGKINFSLINFI